MNAVWAVARNLLKEVFRSRGFQVFLPGLVLVAFFSPRLAVADDLLGRLQVAVTYGLGIPAILIGVATLVVATGSMGHERGRGSFQLLASKPVGRWQVLCGKVVGVSILDALSLACVLVAVLVNVYVARAAAGDGEELHRAERQFFTAHRVSLPRLPGGGETSRALVRPQEEITLTFSGLEPRSDDDHLLVRCRLPVSPPTVVGLVDVEWSAAGERHVARIGGNQRRDVSFASSAVDPSGEFRLILRNSEPRGTDVALVVEPSSVQLYSVYGPFWPNLLRALAILLGQYAFLAAVSVVGAAFFSLPTAGLIGMFVYITALVSSFLRDALGALVRGGHGPGAGAHAPEGHASSLLDEIAEATSVVGQAVLYVIPDFAGEGPLLDIVDGKAILWGTFGARLGWTLIVRAGLLLLLASWLWGRREAGESRE